MRRNLVIFYVIIILSIGISSKMVRGEGGLSDRLRGRILLQVEQGGEAWYVDPADKTRYYLGLPKTAYDFFRAKGVGILNKDLDRIPIAETNFEGPDADGDGLSDRIEESFGTDKNKRDTDGDGYDDKTEILNQYSPLEKYKKYPIDSLFVQKQIGRIFLQVENNGEAWYVNPIDLKRYYLGTPKEALEVMKTVGLGVNNDDIKKINTVEENKKQTSVKKVLSEDQSFDYSIGNKQVNKDDVENGKVVGEDTVLNNTSDAPSDEALTDIMGGGNVNDSSAASGGTLPGIMVGPVWPDLPPDFPVLDDSISADYLRNQYHLGVVYSQPHFPPQFLKGAYMNRVNDDFREISKKFDTVGIMVIWGDLMTHWDQTTHTATYDMDYAAKLSNFVDIADANGLKVIITIQGIYSAPIGVPNGENISAIIDALGVKYPQRYGNIHDLMTNPADEEPFLEFHTKLGEILKDKTNILYYKHSFESLYIPQPWGRELRYHDPRNRENTLAFQRYLKSINPDLEFWKQRWNENVGRWENVMLPAWACSNNDAWCDYWTIRNKELLMFGQEPEVSSSFKKWSDYYRFLFFGILGSGEYGIGLNEIKQALSQYDTDAILAMKHKDIDPFETIGMGAEELKSIYRQGDIVALDAYPIVSPNPEDFRTKEQRIREVIDDPDKILTIWEGGTTSIDSQDIQKNWILAINEIAQEESLSGFNIWAYQDNYRLSTQIQQEALDLYGLKDIKGDYKVAWDSIPYKKFYLRKSSLNCGEDGLCSTTITAGGDSDNSILQIWVKDSVSQTESLMGCIQYPDKFESIVPWIRKDRDTQFILYRASSCNGSDILGPAIEELVVPKQPYLNTSAITCDQEGINCDVTIKWKGDETYPYSQVFVTDKSTNQRVLFACSGSNDETSQVLPNLITGKQYVIELFSSQSCNDPNGRINEPISEVEIPKKPYLESTVLNCDNGLCSATISWRGSPWYSNVELWVKDKTTGEEALVACSDGGTDSDQLMTTMVSGREYTYSLFSSTGCTVGEKINNELVQITVPPKSSVSASELVCSDDGLCSSNISWNGSQWYSYAQLWVKNEAIGDEVLMSCANGYDFSELEVLNMSKGNDYSYIVYPGSGCRVEDKIEKKLAEVSLPLKPYLHSTPLVCTDGVCKSNLFWRGYFWYPKVQVWVKDETSGTHVLIACSDANIESEKESPNMLEDRDYTYSLYAANGCSTTEKTDKLDELSLPPKASLSTSEIICANGLCSTNISWNGSSRYPYAQLWVKNEAIGDEVLMSCANGDDFSVLGVSTMVEGNNYLYSVYPSSGCGVENKIELKLVEITVPPKL